MDRAINQKTGEVINAFEIGNNASYQDKKDVWIARREDICNWDELEEKNINEVPVHFVSHKTFTNWRGTEVFVSPHFAKYPNHPAKTVPESPQHKMLKNFIYNALKKKDIELIISKQKRKGNELKKVSINELNDLINWNEFDIEITSRGYKTLRADILLPFKSKHEVLGYGIDFEIQLQNQTEKITFDRSIKWALNGFSVVWLFENDFHFNKDKTDIELKKKELKVYSYSQELYFSGKQFCKELKRTVIHQSRLLDNKKEEIEKGCNKKIKEMGICFNNLKVLSNEIYEDIKKQINGFFGYKIKELGDNFNDEVSKRVEENFFENNKDKLFEVIDEGLRDYLKDIKLSEAIEEITNKIDYDEQIRYVRKIITAETQKKLEGYNVWREFVSNPPTCSKCGSHMQIKKGKYGLFLGCLNYPDCKNIINNIPEELKRYLEDDKNKVY